MNSSPQETVSVAESLSGGLVCDSFVRNAGASKFFKGGVVTYSLESKHNLLNIPTDLLKRTNCVSQHVSEMMSENVAKLFTPDYGISTTGYANSGNYEGREFDYPYAFVSIANRNAGKIHTKLVSGSKADSRNEFRKSVVEIAVWLWTNRKELVG